MMLIKIRGIVFSWSLRVWVTRLLHPFVQDSKISSTKTSIERENPQEKFTHNSHQAECSPFAI